MTRFDSPALVLLARLLLAAIFVTSGFGKLASPDGTIAYISSSTLPAPQLAYYLALLIEIGGGLAIVVGLLTPLVAVALALFCVVTGFAFHYHPADMGQMVNFWKNIAITGGFLVLAAHGAGAWSIDALLFRRRGALAI